MMPNCNRTIRSSQTGLATVVALLALAGCASAEGWVKAGTDAPTTASAYSDCRALADAAVVPENQADEDIMATRRSDWERAQVLSQQTTMMKDDLADRTSAIIDNCMHGKGFAKAG